MPLFNTVVVGSTLKKEDVQKAIDDINQAQTSVDGFSSIETQLDELIELLSSGNINSDIDELSALSESLSKIGNSLTVSNSKMILTKKDFSVAKSTTNTVLNISGAGELHGATITQNTNLTKKSHYLKITLDGDFTFYLNGVGEQPGTQSGGIYNSETYNQSISIFSVSDYLAYTDESWGSSSDGYFRHIKSYFPAKYYPEMAISGYRLWHGLDTQGYMSGRIANIPSECTTLEDSYHFIITPAPLRFNKSLVVECVNNMSNYSTSGSILYKLL